MLYLTLGMGYTVFFPNQKLFYKILSNTWKQAIVLATTKKATTNSLKYNFLHFYRTGFLVLRVACRGVCLYLALLCGSASGSRFGCRNLEKGGCSLYWHCGQKPSGFEGEYVQFQIRSKMNTETRSLNSCVCLRLTVFLLVSLQDYKPEEDPCRFKSMKTSRGPLGPDWKVQSLVINVSDMSDATEIHDNQRIFWNYWYEIWYDMK